MAKGWHILGAGAIGCLFADALASSGAPTTLVLRANTPSAPPLQMERNGQTHTRSLSSTNAPDVSPIDHLLVTTKAYDVVSSVNSVRHRLTAGATIVLLANGLGYAEDVASLVPGANLYCGTTTEGAFRRALWHICHAGRGQTLLGAFAGRASAPDWFDDWQALKLECRWTNTIHAALWHKLAINCAINPLTARHRCHNGELANNPVFARQVTELCKEIADVSRAAGFDDIAHSIEGDAFDVIQRTAANRSSMLQDTLAGRSTEIEFITGHLVNRAEQLGIEVPANRDLLEQIRNA